MTSAAERPVYSSPFRRFVEFTLQERTFLLLIAASFLFVGATFQNAEIARWTGFIFAGYAVVGNDSIQTLGTFISSNGDRKWWKLWMFIGGIFAVTIAYSWFAYDGDVTYNRLATKGFETTPTQFSFLQVAAPIFLLVLTRMRIPVSTSILLLTSFATETQGVTAVLGKSLVGYIIAFGASIVIWLAFSKLMKRAFSGPAHARWRVLQWVTSGFLWSVWIMQDAANVAVYLPRQLNVVELLVFIGVIVAGLGLLFYFRGEKVQAVVDEKSGLVDVRAATVVNFVFAVIMYLFKEVNQVPMSTTWVFLGLLAGRELAMALTRTSDLTKRQAMGLLFKDVGYAGVGLFVSLVIAVSVNDALRHSVLGFIGLG